MDTPHLEPPNPDHLFSKPSDDAPKRNTDAMVGERHVDSVLFKIDDLQAPAAAAEAEEEDDVAPIPEPPRAPIQDAKLSSGLIDVNTLLAEPEAGSHSARAVGSLVAEIETRAAPPAPVAAPSNKGQTYMLIAGVLALLGVAIMLAIKAAG